MDPITPLTTTQTQAEEQGAYKEGYWHRFWVAVDIAINVTLLRGQQDETISSHAARSALQGKLWGRILSSFLNLFEKDHGAKAQAADIARAKNTIRIEESAGDLNK